MRHRAVFDMAARLHYLEPADLTQRARSAADSVLDRVLDALLRRGCAAREPRSFTRVMRLRKTRTSSRPRRLADWINPTGARKVHSLIDKVYASAPCTLE